MENNNLKVIIADPCFDENSIANPVIPLFLKRFVNVESLDCFGLQDMGGTQL